MIDLLVYSMVCLISALANLFPIGLSAWIARRVADLSYLLLRDRRKVALENINRAFGNSITDERKKQIARAAFQSAALSMMELFIVKKIAKDAAERFVLLGNDALEEAFKKKKGVVLVIAHIGSWEYLSFLPYRTGRNWSVVVKDIKNPYVNRKIDTLRRVMKVTPIPKDGSIRRVLKALKNGDGVAILIDQWAGDEGLWIDFFGTPTSTTSIPARLAERTGCALIPAFCLRKSPGRYEIHLEKAYEYDPSTYGWEVRITRELNRLLEEQIRRHPEQWLWGHRRWKEKPAAVRAVDEPDAATT